MAYQPISGAGLGMEAPGLVSVILKAREDQRAQEQQRWKQLSDQAQYGLDRQKSWDAYQEQQRQAERQRIADTGAAIEHGNALHNAGDALAAQEWRALHGIQLQQPVQAQGQPGQGEKPHVPQIYNPEEFGQFARQTLGQPGQTAQPEPQMPNVQVDLEGPPKMFDAQGREVPQEQQAPPV